MAQRTERRHRRVRARSLTAVVSVDDGQFSGEVETISQSGLFVRTEKVLAVGAKVQLGLSRTGGRQLLSIAGSVADTIRPDRAASLGRKTGIGIAFDPIPDAEAKERLERLLQESGGVPPVMQPAAAAPADGGELQRLRAQVRGLLIDLSDLRRSVAERDAIIEQLRGELEVLRSALSDKR
ncbi:MAG TPA: PilZ domain-containing protein [Myxococcales bacterium]|nr:PilZ domain-containing protein [Myxococcales bacterium]